MFSRLKDLTPGRLTPAITIGIFAVVFALKLLYPSPTSGAGTLFFIPVALVAVEYGARWGVAAALAALGLNQLATFVSNFAVPLGSYFPRGIGLLIVGALTGWMAERLRLAGERMRGSARHFELSEELVCTLDLEGTVLHVNDSWRRTLGWSGEEIVGTQVRELIHPADLEAANAAAREVRHTGAPVPIVARSRTEDGDYRWLEWSTRFDEEVGRVYMVGRDITERLAVERSGREAQERFRRVFDDSFAGICLVDLEGRIMQANMTLVRMLGYENRRELAGRETQVEFVDEGSLAAIRQGIDRLFAGEVDSYRGELQLKQRDGGLLWVDMTMSLIRDPGGTPLYRMTQVLDVQARKEAEEQLRRLADHDSLSGVYNRRRFEDELARELGHGAQHARSAALLLFDVDGFKQINDSLGHAAGDAVIARLGKCLRDGLRTGDVVARLGGDEFAILLRRVGEAEAEEISAKIQSRARDEIAAAVGGAVPTGLSVGFAMIDGAHTVDGDELLRVADTAMYDAKRLGGDRVVYASA